MTWFIAFVAWGAGTLVAVRSFVLLVGSARRGERSVDRMIARFARRPGAVIALGILVGAVLAAVLSPWLAPYDPTAILDPVGLRSQPPSWAHPFGTDPYGRDVLSRVLVGTRVSLGVAALSVVISTSIGTVYGATAGYAGGLVDRVMMRSVDVAASIPRVLLLPTIAGLWRGLSLPVLILLIGLTGWFGVSRLVRAQVLALRDQDVIVAARALGASDRVIVGRHVIPNVVSPALVAATLGAGDVMLLEAGLSYLGVGVQPPAASWGTILMDVGDYAGSAWWVALFPGIALVLTVIAVNVVGDGLRAALDPKAPDAARRIDRRLSRFVTGVTRRDTARAWSISHERS